MSKLPIPLHQLQQKLYNVPLLVTPEVAQIVSDVLSRAISQKAGWPSHPQQREADAQVFPPVAAKDGSVIAYAPRASGFVGTRPRDPMTGAPSPYKVTSNGTAIIRIEGELVNRGEWLDAESGLVSYEGIKHQCSIAENDTMVKNVIIDMCSPGGEAVGCFDCAAAIRRLAAVKPVVCFVNGIACSAGYALASACTKIVSIPEGRSGSIGVLMMHVDYSVALQLEGIKPTFIFAGAHKVDGNPFAPLPPEVQARFQSEIDKTYAMFIACVMTGRKGLSEEAIRSTGALVYSGPDALSLGLIDSIGTFEDLLIELAQPDSITLAVTDDGGAPDDSDEPMTKQGASTPANMGALAGTAQEDDMSKQTLWNQFVAAMGGTPSDAVGVAGTAVEGTPPLIAGAAVAQQKHLRSAAGSPACGASASEMMVEGLTQIECGDCMRLELTRLQTEADAKRTTDATAAAARIETDADAFIVKHCANIGAEGTAAFRDRFVAAAKSSDAVAQKDLETIAASVMPRTKARIDTSKGPKVEQLAAPSTKLEIHAEALSRLAARGVQQNSPTFAMEYDKEVSAIMKENGGASVAA